MKKFMLLTLCFLLGLAVAMSPAMSAEQDAAAKDSSGWSDGDLLLINSGTLINNGVRIVSHDAGSVGNEYILDFKEYEPGCAELWSAWSKKHNSKVAIGGKWYTGGKLHVEWIGLPDQLTYQEFEMIAHANAYRERHGLRDLIPDFGLMRTAREQSRIMTSRGMNHGYTSGWGGENIAMGQRDHREVTITWYNSPGHRANMLRSGFRYIGVGAVGHWWTQQFK